MFIKPLLIIPIIAVAVIVSVAMFLYTEPEPVMPVSSRLAGIVNIGLLFPLTGDLSTYGEDSHAAALLAVEDAYEWIVGEGNTWSLDGMVEDSQTSPVVALEKVEALHANGVKVIVGPGTSASLRNLMGYTAANNMVMISYSSTAPSLAIPNDNVFRTVPDDNQGPPIASLMASRGIDVLIPVWRGDAWGDGLKETTARSFSDMGGIVGEGKGTTQSRQNSRHRHPFWQNGYRDTQMSMAQTGWVCCWSRLQRPFSSCSRHLRTMYLVR